MQQQFHRLYQADRGFIRGWEDVGMYSYQYDYEWIYEGFRKHIVVEGINKHISSRVGIKRRGNRGNFLKQEKKTV